MWYLKIKYKHSDCLYSPKLQELNLNVHFYYLGEYLKGKYVHTSAIQQIIGERKNIKKYIKYMKSHPKIIKIEIYGDVILTLARHRKDILLYEAVYSPELIYPAPAYLSKDGYEIIELSCWNRKPLQELINSFEKNKTTTFFKILQFHEKKLDDIYLVRLLPKLPEKQKKAILLAFKNGYYQFPRKINLDKLAKIMKISKQTFRENLRKAETKLIPKLISE